jgi:hypothetical protein
MGRPHIDSTAFGSITVEGAVFEHDVVIASDGTVAKRKKNLSKSVYGSSHTISLGEITHVLDRGRDADELIVGSGQYDNVRLSPEAAAFVEERDCRVLLLPTPAAIGAWNRAQGKAIGLFHVTC